ncbi:MAG: TonB-dependent receptor [Pseudomonadota bacterium]
MGQSTRLGMLCNTAIIGAASALATQGLAQQGGAGAAIVDVPEQALLAAIEELSSETGKPIAVNRDAVAARTSRAVKGPMTAKQALDSMVNDPEISVRELGDGSLVVSRNDGLGFVTQDGTDENPFDLGVILITGERVERDLFNTVSSVRAYGSEELEENVQNTDLERVISDAGNVTFIGNSNQTPVIRGQSSGGPASGAQAAITGQLPRATLTVDGRVQSFNELAYSPTSIWDVETIEVFRGPQTTSQGANAIAGAINVRTRDPVFEQEFSALAELGTDNKRRLALMANTPLSDSVALRFAVEDAEQDGFINFPNGIPSGSEAEQIEQTTARAKLLFEPVDLPQLSTQLTLSYSEFSRPQTQNVVAPFEDLNSNNADGFPSAFVGDTTAVIHDFEYGFDNGITLRNQIAFSEATSSRVTGEPGAPDFPAETRDISNEFLLDYAPEGAPVSALFGVFLRDTHDTAPDNPTLELDSRNKGLGVFGEVTYRFENGFDVTGGLRYERNEQERFLEAPGFGIIGPNVLDYESEFDAWLPSLTVGYEPHEDLRLAVKASRGFNPGGVSGAFGVIFGIIDLPDGESPFFEFEEETVDSLEFSMRGRFLDDRLFVGANLFYSEFKNYQFTIATLLPSGDIDSIISNAEEVTSYGLELDAQYSATDRLQLTGSVGLLRTKVDEFDDSAIDIVGNDLPFAPSFTASLGLDYWATDKLSLGGQLRHSAGYFSDIENTSDARVDDFTTLDLRGSYQVSERAELYAYVNNAFDIIEPTQLFAGGDQGVTTRPREFGIGVRATW